jgi:hypothetical protein
MAHQIHGAKVRVGPTAWKERPAPLKQWEQELATVNSPEIRALAEQRGKTAETFGRPQVHRAAQAQFGP